MPRPGFYNDNEYRAYPFIFKPGQANLLPYTAVVDCGVIMGLDSEFDVSQHVVWLNSVRRIGNSFKFDLQTNAPGAENLPLVFSRAIDAEEWQSEYIESAPYVKDANSCAVEPAWSGFLVTGPLNELLELLPQDGEISLEENFVLEPARIQSLVKSYLRSITVGNMSRPMARSACDNTNDGARAVIINARCIAGDIRFKEGYNAQINQLNSANEINITAATDAGQRPDGDLCENGSEIPFYPDEIPPAGSQFLSGGPACDELVSSINGVQGPEITIAGGTGVVVRADAETPNTITIALSENNISGNC
ncbi:MAG: hypothetical protein EBU90_23500 [Proteobacteria bacterium]|nr:hypothetical protein [Pseudomonadota bacterium]